MVPDDAGQGDELLALEEEAMGVSPWSEAPGQPPQEGTTVQDPTAQFMPWS